MPSSDDGLTHTSSTTDPVIGELLDAARSDGYRCRDPQKILLRELLLTIEEGRRVIGNEITSQRAYYALSRIVNFASALDRVTGEKIGIRTDDVVR